jgi:hypothetical protein
MITGDPFSETLTLECDLSCLLARLRVSVPLSNVALECYVTQKYWWHHNPLANLAARSPFSRGNATRVSVGPARTRTPTPTARTTTRDINKETKTNNLQVSRR